MTLKAVAGGGGGAASGITIGTSVITGGTNTRVLFDDNGVVGEDAAFTFTKASGLLTATALTLSGGALTLSGNQSVAAWTTNGIRLKGVAGTFTDTTSSGTVAAAYTNVLGGNTIAASSATTFTQYESLHISAPTASTNVTMTNKTALGVDSISVGGAAQSTFALAATGTVSISGATTVGSLTVSGSGNITMGANGTIIAGVNGGYNMGGGRGYLLGIADAVFNLTNNASSAGVSLDTATDSAMKVRNRANNAFATVQGKLTTDANATTGLAAGVLAALTNASITITDAAGQVYRVPCII